MRYLICLACYILITLSVSAQNLVPNGSFELYSQCPTGLQQFKGYCQSWHSYTAGSPDYLNACATPGAPAVPNNYNGEQAAYQGSAYAGLYVYPPTGVPAQRATEYIATKMSPMTYGKNYEVSMYVSLADRSLWACDGLGVYFKTDSGYVNTTRRLSVKPQISYASYGVVDEDNAWTRLSATFRADSEYSYMVIGLFADTPTMKSPPDTKPRNLPYAYYYIDSVTITEVVEEIVDTGGRNCPIEGEWLNKGGVCRGDTLKMLFSVPDSVEVEADNEIHPALIDSSGGVIQMPIQIGTGSGIIMWRIPENLAPGAYRLRFVTTNPRDTSYYEGIINIEAVPIIEITANHPACGEELRLEAKSTQPGPIMWQGPRLRATGPTQTIPDVNNGDSGTYVAYVGEYCIARDTIELRLNCDSLYLPTAFSPNGDGKNDVLYIYGTKEVMQLHLSIYNKWGQLVFETTDRNAGWDGSYKGEKTDLAAFAYVLHAVFASGKTVHAKGSITVIR